MAKIALRALLEESVRLGGGTVETCPKDVEAVKTSSSFLNRGTVRKFLDEGFEQVRPIGKSQWVVRKIIRSS